MNFLPRPTFIIIDSRLNLIFKRRQFTQKNGENLTLGVKNTNLMFLFFGHISINLESRDESIGQSFAPFWQGPAITKATAIENGENRRYRPAIDDQHRPFHRPGENAPEGGDGFEVELGHETKLGKKTIPIVHQAATGPSNKKVEWRVPPPQTLLREEEIGLFQRDVLARFG